MIITLVKANFSANNIGVLNNFSILTNLGLGCTYNGPSSIKKNDSLTATISISNGYVLNDNGLIITMSGNLITDGIVIEDNLITINIPEVTGTIIITALTYNNSVNPPSEENSILTQHSAATGFYLNSESKFCAEPSSSMVVYQVQPNTTYYLSVEKKPTGIPSNANLIFAPVKSLNNFVVNGSPDWATGYDARIVEMSTNGMGVYNYQFTTPSDCMYILLSSHQSGASHTISTKAISKPEVDNDVPWTKIVSGVYLGPNAKFVTEASSQVLCYAVAPDKTYSIGAPLDTSKKIVVCCVKSIDNIVAGNTATFATDWSDRQIGDAGANLTVTTPADCTHLIFSNYLQNQAPSYVKLID